MNQPGFFDLQNRITKLTKMGDPLVQLSEQINWEEFRSDLAIIHEKDRKSNAGAKPFDVILMFKILVLQQLNNLSDDRIEYQIRDRISFMRFLGLGFEDRVPDSKTVWLFRELLKEFELIEVLFARFHQQLARRGYVAKAGQMIDATFVEVPRQRNSREENLQVKAGETPSEWTKEENKNMLRQKDVDASLHDSQVFEELLDHEIDKKTGKKRAVSADSAYRSEEKEAMLVAVNIESRISEKGSRNHPLTAEQKASNTEKSRVRSRVEHIFGAQAHMGSHFVRTIGILRAEVKIGMMNLVYNMIRLGQLIKRDGIAASAVT